MRMSVCLYLKAVHVGRVDLRRVHRVDRRVIVRVRVVGVVGSIGSGHGSRGWGGRNVAVALLNAARGEGGGARECDLKGTTQIH